MHSVVLVFTYMLVEHVSSTTLAEVGLCGFCILYVSVGEINAKLQVHPFHSPGSFGTHKFVARLDVHVTFVWVLTTVHLFLTSPFHTMMFGNYPSFTQCDDLWIYL